MFSALKGFVSKEWKRLVKYTISGAVVGSGIGAGGGYLLMEQIGQETEEHLIVVLDSHLPEVTRPVYTFIVGRMISGIKREGIEGCVYHGCWYGLFAGTSLGITRVTVGVGLHILKSGFKFVSKKK
eukprot:gene9376-10180_t